jgi:hypothetical protein
MLRPLTVRVVTGIAIGAIVFITLGVSKAAVLLPIVASSPVSAATIAAANFSMRTRHYTRWLTVHGGSQSPWLYLVWQTLLGAVLIAVVSLVVFAIIFARLVAP